MIKFKKDVRCRACLNPGSLPLSNEKPLYLIDAIRAIANIEISENDKFPKLLCEPCFGLLKSAIRFKTAARNSDKLLRQVFKQEPFEEVPIVYSSCSDKNTEIELKQGKVDKLKIKNEQVNANFFEIDLKQDYVDQDQDIDLVDDDLKTEKNLGISKPADNLEVTAINKSVRTPRNQKVPCDVCKKYVNKDNYKAHLAHIHGIGAPKLKKKLECKICNKLIDRYYYKKHMSILHSGAPSKYVCYVCGKVFKFVSGFRSHMTTHSNEFPYKCQLCPYRGRHSDMLRKHMQSHQDYKYKCTECSATFLSSGNLKRHSLTHKERDIKCDSCTRAFHSTSDLEKHIQADHLGMKEHVCGDCGMAFGYRRAMNKHKVRVHNRKKLVNGRMPSYMVAEKRDHDDFSN